MFSDLYSFLINLLDKKIRKRRAEEKSSYFSLDNLINVEGDTTFLDLTSENIYENWGL